MLQEDGGGVGWRSREGTDSDSEVWRHANMIPSAFFWIMCGQRKACASPRGIYYIFEVFVL